MRMRIKSKIIISSAVIISLAILASGIVAYLYFRSVLTTQIIKDETIKLKQTAQQLQYIQDDIHQFAHYILVDEEIQRQFNAAFSFDLYEKLSITDELSRKLKNYLTMKNYTDSIIMVYKDGETISSDPRRSAYFVDSLTESWYTDFLKKDFKSGFSDIHTLATAKNPVPVISYIISFNPLLNPSSKLHYLIIHIYLDHIENALPADGSEDEPYVLLNGDKALLFNKNGGLAETHIREILSQSGSALVSYEKSRDKITFVNQSLEDRWKLIAVKSTMRVMNPIQFVLYFFAATTFVSIGVIMLTITPIISNITRPISKLTHAMKQISMGNMDTTVTIESGDEIELLGAGFNRMTEDIKAYIHQSVEDEKIKHKLQNDLLLSQINPHFIYNTLNTVIYLAQGNQDIITITESFIHILQDAVKEGREGYYSTVREEIESLKHYLIIQSYRYPNRFVVNWEVKEETLEGWIPRMILQPLLENALFHGIIPMETPGTITIRIALQQDLLSISIADDGIGMDESKVELLAKGRQLHDSFSRMRPIGLSNVRELIRNLYGPLSRFDIESGINQGTRIALLLPHKQER